MATKVDPAAAKARQQKIILIAGGVILAGLVAFQAPKLLKGSSSSSAAPAATTTTPGTTTETTPGTTTGGITTPAVATTGGQTAQVAGVVIRPAGPPAAGTGQLWSLSRFKVKDPFVQQVKEGSGAAAASAGGPTASPGAPPVTGGSAGGAIATPTTATPVALGYATLMVNGKPQQLQLKQLFPKSQPTFVLIAVDKKSIKIGVAGGKFTGGGAIKLEFGKAVTLMNTTTGQRFVMKLVFTGEQPEQIAAFKQPAAGTTTTAPVTTGTPTASQP